MSHLISQQRNSNVVPIRPRVLLQRLDIELELLRAAAAKIGPGSKEQWAIPIYQRIIRRHERLLMGMTGG